MLKPTTSPLLRAALATAALASLAGPGAAAEAARKPAPSSATYLVTFKAQMTDQWRSRELATDDCFLTGALCVRDTKGEGAAKLNVSTRRPTRLMVLRGAAGRPPMVGVGSDPGLPLTGTSLRSGSLTTDYSGPWEKGNPDRIAPTTDCGRRGVTGDVTFAWRGRNQLGISPIVEEDRDACPDGPTDTWEWEHDEGPSLSDAIAQVAQTKFLRTKQFTISGQKAWKAVIEPTHTKSKNGSYDKDGSRTVTWRWEATFRMEGAKKRR